MPDPTVETVSGTPEHIAEMVAKADAGTNNHGDAGKPLLAGKYKSEEDLNKGLIEVLKAKHGGNLEDAYKALAGNLNTDSNASDKDNTDTGTDSQTADDAVDSSDSGDTDGTDKGSDADAPASQLIDDATIEFAEQGELSPETYEKLGKAYNVDKSMIDNYIAGMQAQAEVAANTVYSMVGGKEAFESMKTWAATGLDARQIEMFNEDIITGDPAKISRAVQMCNDAYTRANGKQGSNFLNSNVSTSNSTGGYGSLQEFKRDLADSRYSAGDSAFHALVQAKLKNTTTF